MQLRFITVSLLPLLLPAFGIPTELAARRPNNCALRQNPNVQDDSYCAVNAGRPHFDKAAVLTNFTTLRAQQCLDVCQRTPTCKSARWSRFDIEQCYLYSKRGIDMGVKLFGSSNKNVSFSDQDCYLFDKTCPRPTHRSRMRLIATPMKLAPYLGQLRGNRGRVGRLLPLMAKYPIMGMRRPRGVGNSSKSSNMAAESYCKTLLAVARADRLPGWGEVNSRAELKGNASQFINQYSLLKAGISYKLSYWYNFKAINQTGGPPHKKQYFIAASYCGLSFPGKQFKLSDADNTWKKFTTHVTILKCNQDRPKFTMEVSVAVGFHQHKWHAGFGVDDIQLVPRTD